MEEQVQQVQVFLASDAFAYIEEDIRDDINAIDGFLEDSDRDMNSIPKVFRYLGEKAQLKRFRPMLETHVEMCKACIDEIKQQIEPKQNGH